MIDPGRVAIHHLDVLVDSRSADQLSISVERLPARIIENGERLVFGVVGREMPGEAKVRVAKERDPALLNLEFPDELEPLAIHAAWEVGVDWDGTPTLTMRLAKHVTPGRYRGYVIVKGPNSVDRIDLLLLKL